QVATYVLPVHARESSAPDAEGALDEGEFWAFAAAHPRELPGTTEPWWHAKQSIAALALPPAQPSSGISESAATKRPMASGPAAPAALAAPAAPPGPHAPAVGASPAASAVPAPAAPAAPADAPTAEDAWWVPAAK
ncbi:MAG TPA: hypothetical protein VK509_14185, partial [Polyangiales bacterium]|nr:hypothetical protein [Polyangiales bacterium]